MLQSRPLNSFSDETFEEESDTWYWYSFKSAQVCARVLGSNPAEI